MMSQAITVNYKYETEATVLTGSAKPDNKTGKMVPGLIYCNVVTVGSEFGMTTCEHGSIPLSLNGQGVGGDIILGIFQSLTTC